MCCCNTNERLRRLELLVARMLVGETIQCVDWCGDTVGCVLVDVDESEPELKVSHGGDTRWVAIRELAGVVR